MRRVEWRMRCVEKTAIAEEHGKVLRIKKYNCIIKMKEHEKR